MSESNRQHEFTDLFSGCERDLYRYIFSFFPRDEDARDVLQETACQLWAKFAKYDPARPFGPWARKFALVEIHRHRQRQSYRDWMLAPFSEALVEALGKAFSNHEEALELRHQALQVCLQKLTPDQVDLLHRRYWDRAKLREIAAALELSEDQVSRRLQKIRHRLHQCISKTIAEEGVEV